MEKDVSRLDFACFSVTGKVRSRNEDNIVFFGKCLPEEHGDMEEVLFESIPPSKNAMAAVFDGLGGEQAGEKASFIAAIKLLCIGETYDINEAGSGKIVRMLNAAVCKERKNGGYKQIGTTMSLIVYGNGLIKAVNVGDSPIYLFRNGRLQMLSVSHTVQRERLPNGERKKALVQFLGIEEEEFLLDPHICSVEIQRGDMVLVCSDGLTDMLEEREIAGFLSQRDPLKEVVEGLVGAANDKGGVDNITACVMKAL